MGNIKCSLGLCGGLVARELLSGNIGIESVESFVSRIPPSELFWRQLANQEFDISELSFASLLIATAQGNRDWIALPIFTERHFFHTDILVRTDSGIEVPKDLEGRRIGVPEYQQTASVWTRSILRHEFGVDVQSISWFMEHLPWLSHGGATGFVVPSGISIEYIPHAESIGSLIAKGELDGALRYGMTPNLLDRSSVDLVGSGRARKLFADPEGEAKRYQDKESVLPMNHCIVVRRTLADAYPWLLENTYSAFVQAKRRVLERIRGEAKELFGRAGILSRDCVEELSGDPLPFGIRNQQRDLEVLAKYLFEEGLTPRLVEMNEVFPSFCFVI